MSTLTFPLLLVVLTCNEEYLLSFLAGLVCHYNEDSLSSFFLSINDIKWKRRRFFPPSFAVNNQIYISDAKTFYQIATHFVAREELGDCVGVLLQHMNTI